MLMLDFVFWMLAAYFILIGAYLIFFEWEFFLDPVILFDPQRGVTRTQQIESHWIFAGVWYTVLILTFLKIVPRRH